jgi:hypothetical protein
MINSFYKIEERVGDGYYITWDGIFETIKAAEQRIKTHAANTKDCRVVLYQTGYGCRRRGPVRAEEAQ